MSYFITLADAGNDAKLLVNAAGQPERVEPWGCHQDVRAGDTALLYVPKPYQSIMWTGIFTQDAIPGEDLGLPQYPYASMLTEVCPVSCKRIPLQEIRSALSDGNPWRINCRNHCALTSAEAANLRPWLLHNGHE